MGAINSREKNPIPGVDYSEICFPDEFYMGTGIFTTVVEAGALKKMSPIISNVLNEPYFLMIVTINLGIDQVTALIGKAHDEGAIDRKVFNIPKDIVVEDSHDFTVAFKDWDIKAVLLNGKELENVPLTRD
jgi:hypothetical protein